MHFRRKFGLSQRQARILYTIARRAPNPVSEEALLLVCCGYDEPPKSNLVPIYVSRIRKALKPYSLSVGVIYGSGWFMSKEDAAYALDRPNTQHDAAHSDPNVLMPGSAHLLWSEGDVNELKRCLAKGNEIWRIARKLGRTERAVRCKIDGLRNDGSAHHSQSAAQRLNETTQEGG